MPPPRVRFVDSLSLTTADSFSSRTDYLEEGLTPHLLDISRRGIVSASDVSSGQRSLGGTLTVVAFLSERNTCALPSRPSPSQITGPFSPASIPPRTESSPTIFTIRRSIESLSIPNRAKVGTATGGVASRCVCSAQGVNQELQTDKVFPVRAAAVGDGGQERAPFSGPDVAWTAGAQGRHVADVVVPFCEPLELPQEGRQGGEMAR